ncbi:hypothetical protein Ocin01_12713 [Orchesella cincta]|uniref:protein O-GlcNAc transferase n=1 Tax=Orchesella cincta TaxID=48709 RepID=A0A1D2MM27_ORCCI|nr:hypothetical protein Ocin01_12713 [Orchesella cincta]
MGKISFQQKIKIRQSYPRHRRGFRSLWGFYSRRTATSKSVVRSFIRTNAIPRKRRTRPRKFSSFKLSTMQNMPQMEYILIPIELAQSQPDNYCVGTLSTLCLPTIGTNYNTTVVLQPQPCQPHHPEFNQIPDVGVDSPYLLNLALSDYEDGNYESSKNRCLELLQQDPNNSAASLLLSYIHIQTGDADTAIVYCVQTIQKEPSTAAAFVNLGVAFQLKNQWEDAVKCFQYATQLSPHLIEAYIGIGSAAMSGGNTAVAIHAFSTALTYNPDLHMVRTDLGTLYNSLGNIEEAEHCWREVIKRQPDYAAAYYNLGSSHASTEDFNHAVYFLQQAINCDSQFRDAYVKLASVFLQQKMYEKAISVYSRLLRVSPNDSQNVLVYCNLGNVYYDLKHYDNAISMYSSAIQVHKRTESCDPMGLANLYCDMGNAYKAKDLMAEAEQCYMKALELCSEHPHTLNNMGSLRQQQGFLKDAEEWYRKSLIAKPDFTTALLNLSSILHNSGQLDSALKLLNDALNIDPNFADAYYSVGNVLREKNEINEAIGYYTKTIQLKPDHVGSYSSLALLYKENGLYQEAIDLFKNVLLLNPGLSDAYYNLVHCKQVCCDWDGLEEQKQHIIQIVEEQLSKKQLPCVHPHHTMLFSFTPLQRKQIAERYCKEFSSRAGLNHNNHNHRAYEHKNNLGRGRKLKIGYVSFDFKNHPTSHLMQSIPHHHRRSLNIEAYCYALNPDDGTTFRSKIVQTAEHFVDLSSLTFAEAADRIFNDEIHILVDLNGYTKGAKTEIFALKPAPIQVMWLGYPGTSGASYMDYIITDEVTSPLEFAYHYSEKLAYMPHTYFIGDHEFMFSHLKHRILLPSLSTPRNNQGALSDTGTVLNVPYPLQGHIEVKEIVEICEAEDAQNNYLTDRTVYTIADSQVQTEIVKMIRNETKEKIIGGLKYQSGKYNPFETSKIAFGEKVPSSIMVTTRCHYSLPENAVVFCNFNQLYKFDPSTFESWINILKRVPNGVLWLLRFPPHGEHNLKSLSFKMGLNPDRIIFSEVALKEEHVRRGQLADVCLDTPLCNGHTTSMDILWTGTPVVTLPGETLASRVSASQLTSLGVPELIARSMKEYEDIAVRLGTDLEYLKFIRAKVLRRRSESTLFNTAAYASNLERLYWRMWRRYKNGEEADHITELSTYIK